jgi:hypothetical protein
VCVTKLLKPAILVTPIRVTQVNSHQMGLTRPILTDAKCMQLRPLHSDLHLERFR